MRCTETILLVVDGNHSVFRFAVEALIAMAGKMRGSAALSGHEYVNRARQSGRKTRVLGKKV